MGETMTQTERHMTLETNDPHLRPRLTELAKSGWCLIGWNRRRSFFDWLMGRPAHLTLDFVMSDKVTVVQAKQITVESDGDLQAAYRTVFRDNKRLEREHVALKDKLGRAQERIRTLENRQVYDGTYSPKTVPMTTPPPKRR